MRGMSKRKHSAETIAKMREAKLGSRNPNFGKFGIANPLFGRTRSEETKKKMSIRIKAHWAKCKAEGRMPWKSPPKGHKMSDEAKQKIMLKTKARWAHWKADGITPPIAFLNKGKRLSEEYRKKVSEGVKRSWLNPEYRERIMSKRIPENLKWTVERRQKSRLTRIDHAKAVLEEMKTWEEQGYRCFPVGAAELGIPTPDFIAVKGDNVRAFATEVEFGKLKPDRYKDCKYYDDIVWILRSHRNNHKEIKTSQELARVLGVKK